MITITGKWSTKRLEKHMVRMGLLNLVHEDIVIPQNCSLTIRGRTHRPKSITIEPGGKFVGIGCRVHDITNSGVCILRNFSDASTIYNDGQLIVSGESRINDVDNQRMILMSNKSYAANVTSAPTASMKFTSSFLTTSVSDPHTSISASPKSVLVGHTGNNIVPSLPGSGSPGYKRRVPPTQKLYIEAIEYNSGCTHNGANRKPTPQLVNIIKLLRRNPNVILPRVLAERLLYSGTFSPADTDRLCRMIDENIEI